MTRFISWLVRQFQQWQRRRFYRRYLRSAYWTNFSRSYRTAHPICEHPGCPKPSEQVHHRFYYWHGKSVLYHERQIPGCVMAVCKAHHWAEHGRIF